MLRVRFADVGFFSTSKGAKSMAQAYSGTSNAEDRAKAAASSMADSASDLASKAGQQFDKALDSAQATARSMSEQGREASERMQEVAGNMRVAIDKSVREQPMATLAVVAAFGFVL